jgi:osmotically-inducible protein OsmY
MSTEQRLNRLLRLVVCIGLVAAFVGCAATHKRESTGQYVDDSVVTTKVKAAIFDEPTLKTLQINVKTFKGVVQLSGFVDSAESVRKASEVAAGVEGVREVKNDLIVK